MSFTRIRCSMNLIGVLISFVLLVFQQGSHSQVQVISKQCLRCLCESITHCDYKRNCIGDVCGMFHITYEYWVNAGNITRNGEKPSEQAFRNCVTNPNCAAKTVNEYVKKNSMDCNGDGKINCIDHVYLHILGPKNCSLGKAGLLQSQYTTLWSCVEDCGLNN